MRRVYFIPKESNFFISTQPKQRFQQLDARRVQNGSHPFALCCLDFRSPLHQTPSYKRSTRLVMPSPRAQITILQKALRWWVVTSYFASQSRKFFSMNLRTITLCLLALCVSAPAFAANNVKETERIKESGEVMKEILNIPDNIPQDLLDKAECIVVLPSVKKGAFGVGGSYGRGVMICRSGEHYTGPWGPPALYALEGVSIGFQLGGQATDFVLLVMNNKGARSLLSSKVKLGADASAAAGPKGRTAEGATDIVMNAEILSYSRNKGLFAGISLEGSTLRSDGSANEKLYGKKLTAKEIIVDHKVAVPASARQLVSLLQLKSPKNKSEPKSLQ
jgi:lipid-binding SYLF domain-containing protein